MKLLTVLVGPPGSGKSTLARDLIENDGDHGAANVYVNQDSQGKGGHQEIFDKAIREQDHIIVDRMGFSRNQRNRYLDVARKNGYRTRILVIHQPYQVCLERIRNRFGKHETIHDEKGARSALGTFFGQYERPLPGEADQIDFIYPEGNKPSAIICDLDGTLCNVEHRRHYVRPTDGSKKNWPAFFAGIPNDTVNIWCADILRSLSPMHEIVYCSGRGDNERAATVEWLRKHNLAAFSERYNWAPIYMRDRHDSRQDSIVKEIILDFEILTRYTPYFMIDDRQQVVDMWRKRGYTCLQCAPGDF